ncbi:MAG: hypothetical protein MK077_00995 [Phycisphaerales bacterium]|nr:hypothetical protein [Phycisphaerales bacterium]
MSQASRSLGWALYATSSWTWCIGMFLPVLLMQWFGWSGFLLIALPNCIGAAAMGLLLGSPEASRQFCARHATLMKWFEKVTIGFHLVFLAIIGRWWLDPEGHLAIWLLPLAAITIASALSIAPRQWWPAMGAIAFACGGLVVFNANQPDVAVVWTGTRSIMDLGWMAPIFCIGFILCPWLDGPFHRARQETDGPWSSLILGIAFACMLLVTASYSWIGPSAISNAVIAWLIGQSIFTMAANMREMRHGVGQAIVRIPWLVEIAVVGCIVFVCFKPTWLQCTDLYLRWLSLYGLVFPLLAIAWCRRQSPRPNTAHIIRVTLLILIASGLGEVGFIHGPAWVGAIAVVPVLAAFITWPRSTS